MSGVREFSAAAQRRVERLQSAGSRSHRARQRAMMPRSWRRSRLQVRYGRRAFMHACLIRTSVCPGSAVSKSSRRGIARPESRRASAIRPSRRHSRAVYELASAFACPNDGFMFDAIVNKRIDLRRAGVRERSPTSSAQQSAFADADVSTSYPRMRMAADYVLSDAGVRVGTAAVLISKRAISEQEVAGARSHGSRKYTTAKSCWAWPPTGQGKKTSSVFRDQGALLRDE